jgi:hypothetical protein
VNSCCHSTLSPLGFGFLVLTTVDSAKNKFKESLGIICFLGFVLNPEFKPKWDERTKKPAQEQA